MNKPDFGKYLTYTELVETMKQLHKAYPQYTKLYSIGKTLQNRDLWTMEVTNFETGPGEEKPGIWIDGNTHSSLNMVRMRLSLRSWITG